MTTINYRTADVEGLKVFYREAGRTDSPMLLLLHGFPSAGHMFRELMPQLAEQFHIVAPDFPGFGQTDQSESFALQVKCRRGLHKPVRSKISPSGHTVVVGTWARR